MLNKCQVDAVMPFRWSSHCLPWLKDLKKSLAFERGGNSRPPCLLSESTGGLCRIVLCFDAYSQVYFESETSKTISGDLGRLKGCVSMRERKEVSNGRNPQKQGYTLGGRVEEEGRRMAKDEQEGRKRLAARVCGADQSLGDT